VLWQLIAARSTFLCDLLIPVKFFLIMKIAELGDFNEDEHKEGYLSEFNFVPNQSNELLREVAAMHRKHRLVLYSLASSSL
jgi:hypothetical protein